MFDDPIESFALRHGLSRDGLTELRGLVTEVLTRPPPVLDSGVPRTMLLSLDEGEDTDETRMVNGKEVFKSDEAFRLSLPSAAQSGCQTSI